MFRLCQHWRLHQDHRLKTKRRVKKKKKTLDELMRSGSFRRGVWPRVYMDVSAVSQILPRTHVWCSGRMCTLLFGIPSLDLRSFPQVQLSLSLFLSYSFSFFFKASPPPIFCSPSLSRFPPFFHPLPYTEIFSRVNETICHFRLC